MKKILCTGGAGFIGHHFVEHIIKNTDWEIVIFDKLTYAANGFDRLRDISCFDHSRIRILTVDFTHRISEGIIQETKDVDYIVHMGAETHVDNSIIDAEPFVISNVFGTMHMLEYARKLQSLKKFLYFSTDEVFGPAPRGKEYKEWDRYDSTNPYAATKAGGEELCLAYANTYKLPIIITHTMNVFGERQHAEKFIPKVINKVLKDEEITIHSDKTLSIAGSRHWVHARNVADCLLFLLDKEVNLRDKYNIVGEKEVDNLTLALLIARILKKPLKYKMVDFHSSRPGHDLRYALDGRKVASLGFHYKLTFEDSLNKTIDWTLKHPEWLEGTWRTLSETSKPS